MKAALELLVGVTREELHGRPAARLLSATWQRMVKLARWPIPFVRLTNIPYAIVPEQQFNGWFFPEVDVPLQHFATGAT